MQNNKMYRYKYKSVFVMAGGSSGEQVTTLTADAAVACVGSAIVNGQDVHAFDLSVKNVKVQSGSSAQDKDKTTYFPDSKMSKPFMFFRNENGQIVSVKTSGGEDPSVLAIKKGVAEVIIFLNFLKHRINMSFNRGKILENRCSIPTSCMIIMDRNLSLRLVSHPDDRPSMLPSQTRRAM
jgi:hypothetical protein